jgi:hypothetical protein
MGAKKVICTEAKCFLNNESLYDAHTDCEYCIRNKGDSLKVRDMYTETPKHGIW